MTHKNINMNQVKVFVSLNDTTELGRYCNWFKEKVKRAQINMEERIIETKVIFGSGKSIKSIDRTDFTYLSVTYNLQNWKLQSSSKFMNRSRTS